jgi:hypothetical protein
VFALGRDEEDACTYTLEVQRALEVHLPVLRLLRRRGLLGLYPLGDEIVRIWDLMACRGQNSRSNSPSLTDHLMMRPTVSRLRKISPRGKLETTLILCDWK